VTYGGRSLLGRPWALCLLAATSAMLAGPAYAQGPEPAPTGARGVGPEPAPASRPKASSSGSTKTPPATVQPPAVRSAVVVAPPARVAPQPPASAPLQPPPAQRQPRVGALKKPAPAKPRRARAPANRPLEKLTLGGSRGTGTSVGSSPDGKLLAGGLALFFLLLGETIFLALSVRFLAVTRRRA
jgi:hypothetical protein